MVQIKLSVAFVLAVAAIAPAVALPTKKSSDAVQETVKEPGQAAQAPHHVTAPSKALDSLPKDKDDAQVATPKGRVSLKPLDHSGKKSSKNSQQNKPHTNKADNSELHKAPSRSKSDGSPVVSSREDDDGLFERFFDDFEPRNLKSTVDKLPQPAGHGHTHSTGHKHKHNHSTGHKHEHSHSTTGQNNKKQSSYQHDAGTAGMGAQGESNPAPAPAVSPRDEEMYERYFDDYFEFEARGYDDLD